LRAKQARTTALCVVKKKKSAKKSAKAKK